MKKKSLIGLLIVLGIFLAGGFFLFGSQEEGDDLVCVPASCCHATGCVLEAEAPNCSGIICTMECVPGTLDCNQARCEYIDGECTVVWGE